MAYDNVTMDQVKRERRTDTTLRAMDPHEVVAWIHRLEDEIESLLEWEALKDLVVPQGPTPREATPDDIRSSFKRIYDRVYAANDRANTVEREKARICRAIGHYASHAPLDLKGRSEIQKDLFAICGEKHTHVASIGSDECDLCGRDLRHDVHIRAETTQ